MATIYDRPTTIERVVRSNMKYIIITYFDNGSVFSYASTDDKSMFSNVGSSINYNSTKQSGTPVLQSVQVYLVDATKRSLTLVHDIEV